MKDIKHLDESITQYEEMHARQDLQAFKELLDATKSLLAEHSSRDRSMGSYQVGDFLQLSSINRFMLAAQQSAVYLNDHMTQIQAAQEREQLRVESIYAEERSKQGAMNLVFGVLTLIAGVSALVMSGGTMLPIVAAAFKVGALATFMYGASNSIEAGQNIYYGLSGDGKSFAMNPIRDTIFLGNGELYHGVGQVFTLTTGVFIPIAQTQSIAQGISQFFWGTVGGLATGQAAYHGTKLLGGNEDTAQLMNLLGNFIGGYKFSKVAENFSLNTIRVPKVTNKNNLSSSDLDRGMQLERYTVPEIKNIVKAEGYSLKDFSDLLAPEKVLTSEQEASVRKVRETIGLPGKNTIMNKTIPTEYVEGFIKGKRNSFRGYITVDKHSAALTTLSDIYEGNRLDYPNTPFDLKTTKTFAKITFTLDKTEELYIPFGDVENGSYPFTGRGFTGSKNILLPEYKLMTEHVFKNGDKISIFESETGKPIKQYIFNNKYGWIIQK